MVIYLAPGVDRVEFHNICIVGTSAVGVPASVRHTSLSPPTVSLFLCVLKFVWLVLDNNLTVGYFLSSVVRDDRLGDKVYCVCVFDVAYSLGKPPKFSC